MVDTFTQKSYPIEWKSLDKNGPMELFNVGSRMEKRELNIPEFCFFATYARDFAWIKMIYSGDGVWRSDPHAVRYAKQNKSKKIACIRGSEKKWRNGFAMKIFSSKIVPPIWIEKRAWRAPFVHDCCPKQNTREVFHDLLLRCVYFISMRDIKI